MSHNQTKFEVQCTEAGKTVIFHAIRLRRKLELGDLQCCWVANERLLLGSLEVKPKFRRQGVGTELMEAVFDYSRENGVRQMFGNVRSEHLREFPDMLKWYQGFGFTIVEPEDERFFKAIEYNF